MSMHRDPNPAPSRLSDGAPTRTVQDTPNGPQARSSEGPQALNSRLDIATSFVKKTRQKNPPPVPVSSGARWGVNIFEGGEAVIFPLTQQGTREHVSKGQGKTGRAAQAGASRAAAKVRRYCMANNLDRMLTLTYASEPHDWEEAWMHIEAFRRLVYRHFDQRIPMVIVPEIGSKNGRKHFHVALGRYIPKETAKRLWGRGFVDIRRFRIDKEAGEGEKAKAVAGYLTAYVKKGFTEGHDFGKSRYTVTHGFTPKPSAEGFTHLDEAEERVASLGEGFDEWRSSDVRGWQGPPVSLHFFEPGPVKKAQK